MQTEKIKIAIADDHALFRKGLVKLLDSSRYDLLFDVENGKKLIEQISRGKSMVPDIIILDIEMPAMNGYETLSWLTEKYPEIKVLVVSMVDREEAIVRMLKLGVKGYLSKEMEPEDLHEAIASISKKDFYFTDFVTNKLVHSIQKGIADIGTVNEFSLSHKQWESLNVKQKEFVKYACTEMIYDDIAKAMFVSPKTIDGYRDVVFDKLNIKSRVGLVLYAVKNKLISL